MCGNRLYVHHCSHVTVWSQLVPKPHFGETLCLFVPLLLPLLKKHRNHNISVPSVEHAQRGCEHLHSEEQKNWLSKQHRSWMYVQDALWEDLTNMLTAVREQRCWKTLNYKYCHDQMVGQLGNGNLCRKTKRSSFNLQQSSRGLNFLCPFKWTVRNTNSSQKTSALEMQGLQNRCHWQILLVLFFSTSLAEQQRRGAAGALLLSGWASSAIYRSCSDCCQRDVLPSSHPVHHTPCEDRG